MAAIGEAATYVPTGGMVRTIASRLRGLSYDPADFGAIGDGSADNSTALIAMRAQILADQNGDETAHANIVFPRGHYKYLNNAWLYGIRGGVTLDLAGAAIECVNPGGLWGDLQPINTRRLYEDTSEGSSIPDPMYNIDTVQAWSQTITCTTAADAANFSAGDKIFLGGRGIMENSYPPTLRYFESHEITDVDGATGVITLKQKLRYSYNSNWYTTRGGGATVWGAAFFVKDERCNFLEIKNGTILPNSAHGGGRYIYPVARKVTLRNVNSPECEVAPSMSDTVLIEDCAFWSIELDKLCDTVDMRRTKTIRGDQGTSINAGIGVRHIHIVECQPSSAISVSPIVSLNIERTHLIENIPVNGYGAVLAYPLAGTDVVNIRDCTWAGVHELHAVNNGPMIALVSNGGSATTIRFTKDLISLNGLASLKEGHMVFTTDMVKFGRITEITESGGDIVVAGLFNSAPSAGETWKWAMWQNVNVSPMILPTGMPRLRYYRPNLLSKDLTVLSFSTRDLKFPGNVLIDIVGRTKRVVVDVERAATGGSASATLGVWNSGPYYGGMSIDLRTEGRREVTPSSISGSVGADILANLSDDPHEGLNLQGATTDITSNPIVLVTLEISSVV